MSPVKLTVDQHERAADVDAATAWAALRQALGWADGAWRPALDKATTVTLGSGPWDWRQLEHDPARGSFLVTADGDPTRQAVALLDWAEGDAGRRLQAWFRPAEVGARRFDPPRWSEALAWAAAPASAALPPVLQQRQRRALWWAAVSRGDWGEAYALLSRAGADPDDLDDNGRSALFFAVAPYGGNPAAVRLLLGAGADPNRRDAQGQSALDVGWEGVTASGEASQLRAIEAALRAAGYRG